MRRLYLVGLAFIALAMSAIPSSAQTAWNPVTALGVPWASDFAAIAANVINVKTDSRLAATAKGDGVSDDTAAIAGAISLASRLGGATVYFPAGQYKITTPSNSSAGSPLKVPSRVILRGNSSTTSVLYLYDAGAAAETDGTWTWGGIDFSGASLSGITDLGVSAVPTPSTAACAVLWNRGTPAVSEVFFNNLNAQLGNCRAVWIENTNDFLLQGSLINCTQSAGNASQIGPVYFASDTNISVLNSTFTYNYGRLHVTNDSLVLFQGNSITRDAQGKSQDDGTAIESGGIELSFGSNVQVINNTVKTLNAPPDEAGDGESILTQQGDMLDILDAGSISSETPTTITDTNALWGAVTSARLAQYPGEVVAMLSGPATGQVRTIQSINTSTKTITLSQPWSPMPASGDLYSIFRWTLSNATITGNTLIDDPNGIVIYDGCDNCTVQNNALMNSRQIILRVADTILENSSFPEGRRTHRVALNTNIANNTDSNSSGVRPAYIALDVEAFAQDSYHGMGMMNVQVGGNTINPYPANPNLSYKPGASEINQDGFFPCFFYGPAPVKDPVGTVFQNISYGNNFQSMVVAYPSSYLPFTTKSCATSSAPTSPNPPVLTPPIMR